MRIFSITGWSGSGKTTLLTRLIARFSDLGQRVVALKSAPHQYHLEPPAKDSARFLEAGARRVYLAGQNELVTLRKISQPEDVLACLAQEVTPDSCDLLLLEGLHHPSIAMIEVFDSTLNPAPKFPISRLAAMVSDKPFTQEIPNFNINNIEEISHFMEVYHESSGFKS